MEFPYQFRKHQKETVEDISNVLDHGHLVLQAATGSGKTVCALYASLQYALQNDKVVLYLVRTNSQQRQVILELRRLMVDGIAVQGRQRMCLLAAKDRELMRGTPEELSTVCRDRKERTAKNGDGCRYYKGLLDSDVDKLQSYVFKSLPTAEELLAYCQTYGVCPYELTKSVLSKARLITAPYSFFFDPFVRKSFLEWVARPMSDLILIVDEAHNLPEFARGLGSPQLSLHSVDSAEREAMDYGDSDLLEGVSIVDFCNIVRRSIEGLVHDYVEDEDGFLPPGAFEGDLMHAFSITSTKLKAVSIDLISAGECVKLAKRREGGLPRSYIHRLGSFILSWMGMDSGEHVKLVRGNEKCLEAYCLDPSLFTSVIGECHSSVHMSGTLEPLEEYRDSVGLPEDTALKSYPSPFPLGNRKILYAKDVTTRYVDMKRDAELISKMKEKVLDVVNNVARSTVLFFPSYDLMEKFLVIRTRIRTNVYVEEREMPQADLMQEVARFKRSRGVFFAVAGGRLSEGMDFPDRELEVAILVGIPYPKPTAKQRALLRYYDLKFNKGWDYAVMAPTTRRMQQCIGRLIRKEDDRGVALILDNRATNFRHALGWIYAHEDPAKEINEFLAKKEASEASERSPR